MKQEAQKIVMHVMQVGVRVLTGRPEHCCIQLCQCLHESLDMHVSELLSFWSAHLAPAVACRVRSETARWLLAGVQLALQGLHAVGQDALPIKLHDGVSTLSPRCEEQP